MKHIRIFLLFAAVATGAWADTAYRVVKLTSDQPDVARRFDPNLVNPWGLVIRPNSRIMIANAGLDQAATYTRRGRPTGNRINIPGTPTGLVENFGSDFVISNGIPARLIYVTENGVIAAFNSDLDSHNAVVVVDNSASNAVYKGITRGRMNGRDFIYAANFHAGVVEMYDDNFQFVKSFTDATIPAGFAPFNVRNIRDRLFVMYAKQLGPDNIDDEPGAGNGYVDIFDFDGTLIRRFASQGSLNSPWGIVRAPERFGTFSDAVLIGNFGDGTIHAYNPENGNHIGRLRNSDGDPIVIDGLWGLAFDIRTVVVQDPCFCDEALVDIPVLYFTAGPDDETHGLFGFIRRRFLTLP